MTAPLGYLVQQKNVFSVLKIHFTKLKHRVIFPCRLKLGVTYSWRINILFKIDFSSNVVFLGHLVDIYIWLEFSGILKLKSQFSFFLNSWNWPKVFFMKQWTKCLSDRCLLKDYLITCIKWIFQTVLYFYYIK